jgi:hypothetical protein
MSHKHDNKRLRIANITLCVSPEPYVIYICINSATRGNLHTIIVWYGMSRYILLQDSLSPENDIKLIFCSSSCDSKIHCGQSYFNVILLINFVHNLQNWTFVLWGDTQKYNNVPLEIIDFQLDCFVFKLMWML